MVKHLHLTYEDAKHEILKKLKDASGKTWEEFIFDKLTEGSKNGTQSK